MHATQKQEIALVAKLFDFLPDRCNSPGAPPPLSADRLDIYKEHNSFRGTAFDIARGWESRPEGSAGRNIYNIFGIMKLNITDMKRIKKREYDRSRGWIR